VSQVATPLRTIANSDFSQRLGRVTGIAFGIGTQLVFLWTVVDLFLFLRYGGWHEYPRAWLVDLLLAVCFAVPHSILLAPPVSKWLRRWIPSGLQGSLHCTTSCLTLLAMFHYWGRMEIEVWHATGWVEQAILAGFYGSWVSLLYSLYCTGLGYQTGLTQWWYWFRQTPAPKREFVTRGAFRYMRHPVYMSFLGLIWFTPVMTLDHAILTVVWTAYIYAGSYFKDRRLLKFIGEPYYEYGKRIWGLPIIGFGSLRFFR
jgi:methanethiol S-methyltransferase